MVTPCRFDSILTLPKLFLHAVQVTAMSDSISAMQFQLSTDARVNAIINTLVTKGYLQPSRLPTPDVRHITLKCTREGCGYVFLESNNKTNAYMQPIAHMFFHRWEAGKVMNEAVNSELTTLWVRHQPNGSDYISPPPKRTKKRSAPPTPEGVSSVLERSGSSPSQLKQECLTDTAYMVAASCLSFNWFTHTAVKRWFKSMGATFSPTRLEVTAAVNKHGSACQMQLLQRLSESEYSTTVAIDSVTNTNHHKIWSVVLLNNGQAWCKLTLLRCWTTTMRW